jgi:hypothetical protein
VQPVLGAPAVVVCNVLSTVAYCNILYCTSTVLYCTVL